ncbi:MAG: hypothetical protein Q8K22_02305 [Rhodoferax sp.]|nr:hypothetical protein [Rhodoferax sp.]
MNKPPRNLPRFLPTLTEVVDPSILAVPDVPATPDLEDAVWFVMQRVDMLIERRVREETDAMLSTLVAQQLQSLGERLRLELESVVRLAVADAIALQKEMHKQK